ncbi:hypothetical protein AVEN_39135-1 [Araneus ventricosus]|uniref:Tc1-like transposase DDE domain-containing protein n=1 Tax=Araneus ventricosus TaxID=182803 RepID=A0A4Y2P8Q0_ARAVE|nr:hypothetical protein AVEN_39135-1 [Araneus ventricosus]
MTYPTSSLPYFLASPFPIGFKYDQVLPFSQHFHDKYDLVTPIFQDDNSTFHRSGRICDWFDEQSLTILNLDWPAKSPDLNPIENLWGIDSNERADQLAKEARLLNYDNPYPDSNFSLQQACHKFVMTRVQVHHKFVMTRVQACSKRAAS